MILQRKADKLRERERESLNIILIEFFTKNNADLSPYIILLSVQKSYKIKHIDKL